MSSAPLVADTRPRGVGSASDELPSKPAHRARSWSHTLLVQEQAAPCQHRAMIHGTEQIGLTSKVSLSSSTKPPLALPCSSSQGGATPWHRGRQPCRKLHGKCCEQHAQGRVAMPQAVCSLPTLMLAAPPSAKGRAAARACCLSGLCPARHACASHLGVAQRAEHDLPAGQAVRSVQVGQPSLGLRRSEAAAAAVSRTEAHPPRVSRPQVASSTARKAELKRQTSHLLPPPAWLPLQIHLSAVLAP